MSLSFRGTASWFAAVGAIAALSPALEVQVIICECRRCRCMLARGLVGVCRGEKGRGEAGVWREVFASAKCGRCRWDRGSGLLSDDVGRSGSFWRRTPGCFTCKPPANPEDDSDQ